MDFSHIINHLGEDRELYFNAVTPPLIQTAMFCSKTVADMRQMIQDEVEVPFYTRGNNPTTDILRQKLAALEQAEDALLFSSGSAAVAAAIMVNLQTGDHIVSVRKPYSWTNKLLNIFLPRFGITTTFVDGTDAQNFEQAIQPNTKLIYLESPNSWTFEMQDIAAIAKIAQKHQIISVIDNSYATPLLQNPITMGIDITVHSATKYISGHSDTVAGLLCGSKAMIQKIFSSEYMTLGGIISPFNAWLLLRGLRTLPIRLEKSGQNAAKVVEFLENHPKTEKVYYPFSPSHPQYDLARKQMKAGTGMFTLAIKAENIDTVERFCNALKRFLLAVSWGGYESLVFPACTLYNSKNYQTTDLPYNYLRFCLGLEEADVLIEDLKQAFEQI